MALRKLMRFARDQATEVTRDGAPPRILGTFTSARSTVAATPSGSCAAPRRYASQTTSRARAWRRNAVSSSVPSSPRSEEHTSELQSLAYLVCRLLLEKKKRSLPPLSLHTVHRTYRSPTPRTRRRRRSDCARLRPCRDAVARCRTLRPR